MIVLEVKNIRKMLGKRRRQGKTKTLIVGPP